VRGTARLGEGVFQGPRSGCVPLEGDVQFLEARVAERTDRKWGMEGIMLPPL
jgi:hypothetical protein